MQESNDDKRTSQELEGGALLIKCADCGCLVSKGIRHVLCEDPNCCCQDLPIASDT